MKNMKNKENKQNHIIIYIYLKEYHQIVNKK